VSSTRPRGGGALPFTGAGSSLPMLFAALGLLALGTASVVAGRRRRRA
jgi:LPXTG-motif cell wall-anchored protein